MISTQIHKEIEQAKTILLSLHRNPDPDSLGSTLAMAHYLRSIGKEVIHIQGLSEMPSVFSKIPGADKILKKRLDEVDPNAIDLFLILDTGSKDQLVGENELPNFKKSVAIDHHITNNFECLKWVDGDYGSCAEMVFDFLKQNGVLFSEDIARCIYLGMYFDSGGFKFERTTSQTLLKASELLSISINCLKGINEFDNSNTQGNLDFQALALNSIFHYKNLAMALVPYDLMMEKNIKKEEMNSHLVSNLLKSVEGNDVVACATEYEPNKIKISFRTRDSQKYDLSKFASEIGGGGHKAAAGATFSGSLDELREKLTSNFDKLYN